jgi:hypothetical protein
MKIPFPAYQSVIIHPPDAFFLHSGAYSSFVLCTASGAELDLVALMEQDDLWGRDCIQLAQYAVFFAIGSDAVNQPIAVYINEGGRTDPPDRTLSATFVNQGEQIYLEILSEMTCCPDSDQFFLPDGEYTVGLLSWNLGAAEDNIKADPALFFRNVYHELHFETLNLVSL